MTTYTIYGVEADDSIISLAFGSWAQAREGTGIALELYSVQSGDDQVSLVTHSTGGSVAIVCESFLGFDTSSVVGTISSAVLSIYAIEGTTAESDFTVEARLRDWGTDVAVGDWVPGSGLGALTLAATLAVDDAAIPLDTYASFTNVVLAANINQSGVTRLLLNLASHRLATDPSGPGWQFPFSSANVAGTTQDPKLVIETASGGPALPIFINHYRQQGIM